VVLRYRTGDVIDGGLFYEPCPHCGRTLPRLVGKISRNSEIKSMQLDKIKGTLVDFNQLEHVLDDAPSVSGWQLELRKANDDPMELDELVLHVHKATDAPEDKVRRELTNRFVERTEIRPNRIVFHELEEIRDMLGIGVEMKELKIVDHRPGKQAASSKVAGSAPASGPEAGASPLTGPESGRIPAGTPNQALEIKS
jgi:phenylacetate-coenzyme A ligase PaaK-like adenylate-forming protein